MKVIDKKEQFIEYSKNHSLDEIAEYHFDKLGNAITFYARLKTNKTVKDADNLFPNYL